MDTLRCMQAFVAVAERGSFAGAAEQLQVSAVMVGKYIQQLEAHLRLRLLNRTTRRVSVTADGAAYYPPAWAPARGCARALRAAAAGAGAAGFPGALSGDPAGYRRQ
ncbi:hypothetical protein G6F63_016415 [Rhizopus arrhizus]|nr:hypothetical protein G6F63_016415 [Rhizopus arrhizus]